MNERIYSQIPLSLSPEALTPTSVAWVIPVRTTPIISVLATHHIDTGAITFPGGKVKHGETPIVGAIRELEEETGLLVKPDEIYRAGAPYTLRTTQGNGIITYPYFFFYGSICDQTIKTQEPDKHNPWMWYSLPEIIQNLIHNKLPTNLSTQFIDIILRCTYESECSPFQKPVSHLFDTDDVLRFESGLENYKTRILNQRC